MSASYGSKLFKSNLTNLKRVKLIKQFWLVDLLFCVRFCIYIHTNMYMYVCVRVYIFVFMCISMCIEMYSYLEYIYTTWTYRSYFLRFRSDSPGISQLVKEEVQNEKQVPGPKDNCFYIIPHFLKSGLCYKTSWGLLFLYCYI